MDSSDRIYTELLHEIAAIWYIADEYGEKIMLKAPSNVIKSIISGCRMDFLFGKDSQHVFPILHAGTRIYDDPVHYLRLTSVQRFRQEHHAIKKIMEMETVNIHFHNELTVCVATAILKIDKAGRTRVLDLLGSIDDLYSGNYNHHTIRSLNCFDYSIEKEISGTEQVHEIPLAIVEGTLSDFIVMENIFVGSNERNHIIIDEKDEGGIFEKQTWTSLENLFLKDLHRNPKIADKYGYRELTDVLAYHKYGIFLIETKALGVLGLINERDMNRKVSGLQKQVSKAIDQLKGAAKKVKAGVSVFDTSDNELVFDKSIVPHCIVLVSELLPFGDWKSIELKIMQAMIDQPMYLNVMDLRELMRYIGFARGSKERLDASLMDRAEQFVKLQSIHIRVAGEKKSE